MPSKCGTYIFSFLFLAFELGLEVVLFLNTDKFDLWLLLLVSVINYISAFVVFGLSMLPDNEEMPFNLDTDETP